MKKSKLISNIFLLTAILLLNYLCSCTIVITEDIRSRMNDTSGIYDAENRNFNNTMINIEDAIKEQIDSNLTLNLDSLISDSTELVIDISQQQKTSTPKPSIFQKTPEALENTIFSPTNIFDKKEKEVDLNQEYSINIISLDHSNYPDSIVIDLIVRTQDGKLITGLAEPFLPDNRKNSDY
jgi:hypothetical protein